MKRRDEAREPAVAGSFYPGDLRTLEEALDRLVRPVARPETALAVVAPHAGYMYSGAVAGELYSAIAVPDEVVILGPNHTGEGAMTSILTEGSWRTPLGEVPVAHDLGGAIARGWTDFEEDPEAHRDEHSIEVQIPFLLARNPSVTFVPICLMGRSLPLCRAVGEAVAAGIRQRGKPVLIVASSDMNHYESAAVGRRKDERALERLLALDPEGLLEVTRRESISMCGVAPAAAMLFASRALGGRAARLVRYGNSGDVDGRSDRVVGYAGVVVTS